MSTLEEVSNRARVATWSELEPERPVYALVANVDLVVIRWKEGENVSVLYGRCQHRGALMSDGFVRGQDIVCGVTTGTTVTKQASVATTIKNDFTGSMHGSRTMRYGWMKMRFLPGRRRTLRLMTEMLIRVFMRIYMVRQKKPYNSLIQELATYGLERTGHHGPVSAMGVALTELPRWEDIQFVTAQLATLPKLDDQKVGTELVIGPNAKETPRTGNTIFVSDMSFGALSEEAKVALAKGAELAGTGICLRRRWYASGRTV